MPTYSYDCYECGMRSETHRSISDRDATHICPECKGTDTHRVLAAPVVHMPADGTFRGSGKAEMDKRIGADAERKHDYYRKEQEKRNAVRRESGSYAVGRKSDGTYAPVPQERLKQREKAFKKYDYAARTGVKVVHDS